MFEVLAWNEPAAALMEDFAEACPARTETLRAGRSSGCATAYAPLYGIFSTAPSFRHHVVMELRANPLARYLSDPAVTGLVEESAMAARVRPALGAA